MYLASCVPPVCAINEVEHHIAFVHENVSFHLLILFDRQCDCWGNVIAGACPCATSAAGSHDLGDKVHDDSRESGVVEYALHGCDGSMPPAQVKFTNLTDLLRLCAGAQNPEAVVDVEVCPIVGCIACGCISDSYHVMSIWSWRECPWLLGGGRCGLI